MEFRYRAIDSNRPPPATETTPSQSPNPSFPFLSARSMSGKSEEQVREAMIQREIEKEQIRQEIIIAEAARKRELIAEVLQEMATEREMAIRRVSDTGMSLEEKLIMWINQRKLPNQNQNQNNNNLFRQKDSYIDSLMNTGSYNSLITSPMMQLPQLQQILDATGTSMLESNKEKLIVLNRADYIGAKPKADSVGTMQLPQLQQMPEATGTSVLESNKEKLIVLDRADPVGAKRKAEDIQTGLNEDLQVKRQKAKESKAKTMSLESGEIVSSKLPCLGKLPSGKQVESKVRSSYKFWCEICKVGTYCQTVMRDHELGKKHKAAVTQQNDAPEAASTSLSPASVTAPQPEGTTVREDANPQGQKVDEMSAKETTGKKTEGETKKKGTFWCKTCNIQTNSEQTMRNHTLGKKHMTLIEKQQKKLVTVPVRSLNADPGDKESVSIAMDQTKGKVHCLEKS